MDIKTIKTVAITFMATLALTTAGIMMHNNYTKDPEQDKDEQDEIEKT
jgi:hypothetical protein